MVYYVNFEVFVFCVWVFFVVGEDVLNVVR